MRNLNELWEASAGRFADRPAVVHLDRVHSYRELDALIRGFAGGLRRLGVRPGDRVALLMPNCLHSLVCYWGALRAGAVALPINIRLKPAEMAFILGDAGAQAAVVHQSCREPALAALRESGLTCPLFGVGFAGDGVLPVEDAFCPEDDPGPAPAAADDVAAVIYTSGTTGRPKGAMITHGNVLFNVQSTLAGHGFRPDDVHILAVPLFHVTGLNTITPTAFSQGARLVVTARTAPTEILELVQRHRATTFFAVPTTMILLVQTRGIERYDLSSLRLVAYSGAPMPLRAIEQLRRVFPGARLHNFFGLTETTSVTTVLPDDQALLRPASIGRPVPGLELKVVGGEGESLTPGAVGELLVQGPSVVKGYLNRPEATAEAIIDGWLYTGDAAYIDEEGYVFLQGRKKEMILVAAENVYPVEVENVLSSHPAVAEAAVIGVPHPVLGEVVRAVVVLHAGHEADVLSLKRYCSERLASYKVPQHFEFRDALPRNPSGKVVKRELRATRIPVGQAVVLPDHDTEPVKRALAAIDAVHGDGELPVAMVVYRAMKDLGRFGIDPQTGLPVIQLSDRKVQTEFTTVHEVGHHIARFGLGDGRGDPNRGNKVPEVMEFQRLAAGTQAVQEIERLARADLGNETAFRLWKQTDIFARAYAQYVAVKSGDPVLLRQLDQTRQRLVDTSGRKVYYPEQWADPDFKLLLEWFDGVFAARGWLQ